MAGYSSARVLLVLVHFLASLRKHQRKTIKIRKFWGILFFSVEKIAVLICLAGRRFQL